VRFTACDLRCTWCDTAYAFTGGRKMSVDDVVSEVEKLGCDLVEITGGEPLLQKDLYPLIDQLLARGHGVLIETGGHRPIDTLPEPVVAIIDVKCPASGEAGKMHWPNLDPLRPHDEVKFVIADRADFDYAKDVVYRHSLNERGRAVLFSPDVALSRPLLGVEDNLKALAELAGSTQFRQLATAFKRVRNIARELKPGTAAPDLALLQEPAEVALRDDIKRRRVVIDEAAKSGRNYRAAYAEAAGFEPIVARFFNEVLVMADDMALRQARLALMKDLEQLVLQLGDISEIVAMES